MWHGYAIWRIVTQLTADTVDDDGNITEVGTRSLARQALEELGQQSGQSHKITVTRPSNDRQSVLVRLLTLQEPTAQVAYTKLAKHLPFTAQKVADNSTFWISPGATLEERNAATKDKIREPGAEWEPVE
jgi:hypothetical protein